MATGGERWASRAAADTADEASAHETVALLLDELSRLEAELLARDESLAGPHGWDAPAPDADVHLARKVEELTAELTGRDETIAILLEQTQAFEAAADAQRAEWEQLTRWVEEVERRVSERDSGPSDLAERLDAERRRADDAGRRHDADLRAWEAQRQRLEAEADALRRGRSTAPDEGALEAENQRLRAACAELERRSAGAGEAEALRHRIDELLRETDTLKGELRRERDERARERIEAEAALAALRSERARAVLAEPAEPTPPVATAEPRDPGLDPDERIRAFRQHLRELHEREAAERASRGLAGRLSRLWRHTGPG